MILLLFAAIYKRISQYGITENRYFVFITACWILAITLYILISKQKQLRFFAITITIISLLTSFGFWGAFSVSERSQVNQFSKVFTKIKSKNYKITEQENIQFQSIMRYLSSRNAIEKTAPFLGFNPKNVFKDISNWSMSSKISDTLNIEIIFEENDEKYLHFNFDERQITLDIRGYDFLKKAAFYIPYDNKNESQRIDIKNYKLYLDYVAQSVNITKDSITIHKIDIKPLINNFKNKNSDYEVPQSLLTVEEQFDDMSIKLIFNSISLDREKNNELILNYADAYILLKINDNAPQN